MAQLNLLVDTHVLIWLLNRSPEITDHHIELVTDPDNSIFLSAVSIFEMTTKARIGKLHLPARYMANAAHVFDDFGYLPLNLVPAHADLAGRLPGLHKDPFDRLLLAQALSEGITLVTSDATLAGYPGPVRKV